MSKLREALKRVGEQPPHYVHPLVEKLFIAIVEEIEGINKRVSALETENGTEATKQEASAERTAALHRLSQAGEEGQGAGGPEAVAAK